MANGYLPSLRGALRGLAAVLVLFTSAADHYLSALAGIPPIAWCTRQVAGVIRDAYRLGRFGPPSDSTAVQHHITDAEFVD